MAVDIIIGAAFNRLKRQPPSVPPAPPEPAAEERLLIGIRDLLRGQRV